MIFIFIYFLPAYGFEALVLKREAGNGGGDCTFDLAVRREGLVLDSALNEWVLVQRRGDWIADGWIWLALAGLLVFVCAYVEIERLGWDLSAGFGYGRIGIKLVNLKCLF